MKKKREEWDSNRSMTRKSRKTLYYCPRCDRDHVSPGGKCSTCGFKDTVSKSNKKD